MLKTINYLIHFEYVLYVYDNMNVIFWIINYMYM